MASLIVMPFFIIIFMKMSDVKSYYNSVATIYDNDRFGNSYGQFIDAEERILLSEWLQNIDINQIADYGCGTGRLTNFANTGIDISEEMLQIARQKYPEKKFYLLNGNDFPISENTLKAIYSFHVIMHLSKTDFAKMVNTIHQQLEKNGIFIFDILSSKRKNKKDGWHANTSYSIDEIRALVGQRFDIIQYHGILFLPIHRIPSSLRKYFLWLDIFLCKSIFKKYASYYCIYATKK
jgi:SAM-dependent methyltransferase